MANYLQLEQGGGLLLSNGTLLNLEAGAAAYSPVTAFGTNLKVYLNADSITGVDNDAISAITNQGTEAGFSQATATNKPTLNIIGGKKIVRHDGNDVLTSNAAIVTMNTWTFYAVARPTTTTTNSYLLAMGNENYAIICGFLDGFWEYFVSPRTTGASIDTTNFQLVKFTVGGSGIGTWYLGASNFLGDWFVGDWKIIIAIDRAITTAEATDIEAWLAGYL